MVGYVDAHEAALWVQTDQEEAVTVRYQAVDGENNASQLSVIGTARAVDANALTLRLSGLNPGQAYQFSVSIEGEMGHTGTFTTTPLRSAFESPPDFTIAVGGGFDPTVESPLFPHLLAVDPVAMVWLGDDLPLAPGDWMTASGYETRVTRARSAPGMRTLLGQTAHYGVLGPSDFGPPKASRHWSHRETAVTSFNRAWPAAARPFPEEATTAQFRWGDADFFILDAFSFRDSSTVHPRNRRIFGERQLEWLLDALAISDATFKIVVSGMPMLHPTEAPDTLSIYKDEERILLNGLARARIDGLLFLAGGRPMGELSRVIRPNGYPLHELISGSLNRKTWTRAEYADVNYFRSPGTLTLEPHFVALSFRGPASEREVAFTAYNANGAELWEERILASELIFSDF